MLDLTNFVFDAEDGTPRVVRSVMVNGEPWFVASDVALILGYRNAPDMVRNLDEDEAATHNLSIRSENGVEQDREITVINESGLYSAILRSRRPEAKNFKKWVTGEVLPSIRKTGVYVGPDARIAPAAPTPTLFLSHGADILVAADRTFRSLVRTGRSAGLSTAVAIRRANQVTLARTGVDLLTELDAHDAVVDEPRGSARAAVDLGLTEFLQDVDARADGLVVDGPVLSTQLHRMYVHWCQLQVRHPVYLPRFMDALRRSRLVRTARKRWTDPGNGHVHGPHTFAFYGESMTPPDGTPEAVWLGLAVRAADLVLDGLRA